ARQPLGDRVALAGKAFAIQQDVAFRLTQPAPLPLAFLDVEARNLLQHLERAARRVLREIVRCKDEPVPGRLRRAAGKAWTFGTRGLRSMAGVGGVRGKGQRGQRQYRASIPKRASQHSATSELRPGLLTWSGLLGAVEEVKNLFGVSFCNIPRLEPWLG